MRFLVMKEASVKALKDEVRTRLKGARSKYSDWVRENREDFEFIEIVNKDKQGNTLYALPVSVFENPVFKKLKEYRDEITGWRIVDETEITFVETDLDGNRIN